MATLKISDLSVGDWVRCRGRNGRIECLNAIRDDEWIRVAVESYLGTMYQFVGIEDIEPIPITAEMLEKNGFESTTKPNVFTLTHGKLQLYVSDELDGWHISFVNFMERLYILQVIRKSYIHELQHALRFAGVEKEINL